jgi:hypothetical protein
MSKSSVPSISIKTACVAFGVTAMCLHHWRKGSATRPALPVLRTEGRSVQISIAAAEKWAKTNKVEIVVPFAAAAEMVAGGREPSAKAAAKKAAPKPVKAVATKTAKRGVVKATARKAVNRKPASTQVAA